VTHGAGGIGHVSICALELYPALKIGNGGDGRALVNCWQDCLAESKTNVTGDVVTFQWEEFVICVGDELDGIFEAIGSPRGVGRD